MPYVFVYGTLKRGCCRHHHLAGSHFCGPALTRPGFRLFDLGEYPGLTEAPRAAGCIEGELFHVTDDCVRRLDIVEGVADDGFHRSLIPLQAPHGDLAVEAWFYSGDVSSCRELMRLWSPPASGSRRAI
jgi:gamma-glutamylcyclotransferase (GGCT)/AIG2-like uncharacterized protein YtfP